MPGRARAASRGMSRLPTSLPGRTLRLPGKRPGEYHHAPWLPGGGPESGTAFVDIWHYQRGAHSPHVLDSLLHPRINYSGRPGNFGRARRGTPRCAGKGGAHPQLDWRDPAHRPDGLCDYCPPGTPIHPEGIAELAVRLAETSGTEPTIFCLQHVEAPFLELRRGASAYSPGSRTNARGVLRGSE